LERAPGYLPLVELAEREALGAGDVERQAAVRLEEAAAARAGTAFGPSVAPAPDPRWAAAACVAAGGLHAFELGRPVDAAAAYQQALEAVPGYPPAVEALLGLHVDGGDLDSAAELIERELPRAGAVAGQELLERLVGLYELMGRMPSALSALERLAALRPDDLVLRFRLEHLYARAGQPERRVALLEEIAGKLGGPARKPPPPFEIGRVHEELGAPDAAIAAYRRALVLEPDDRTVRGALLALLRRAGRWGELADELRAEGELATGAGALRWLRGAAAVLERRL